MLTAGLGVAAFLFVILAIVTALMVARAQLVNTADVKIVVNEGGVVQNFDGCRECRMTLRR